MNKWKNKTSWLALVAVMFVVVLMQPASAELNISFINPTPTNNTAINNSLLLINTTNTGNSSILNFNNSLVSWWRFNNESGEGNTSFTDWVSNYNTTCGVSCPNYTTGLFGKALNFSLFNVSRIQTSAFQIPNNTGAITYKFWSNTSQIGTIQTFLSHGEYLAGTIWIERSLNSGNLIAEYSNGVQSFKQATAQNFYNGYNNTWIHTAIVFNYTDKNVKFYRNGVLFFNQDLGENAVYPNNSKIKYFGTFSGIDYLLNGSLDDVIIDARAENADEINATYNSSLNNLNTTIKLQSGTTIYPFIAYTQNLSGNISNTETRNIWYNPPNITSFGNNKTNDQSTIITLNRSETVIFNATSDQTVTWVWSIDGTDQGIVVNSLTTSFSLIQNHTVISTATNLNGTASNTWNIIITPDSQNTVNNYNLGWVTVINSSFNSVPPNFFISRIDNSYLASNTTLTVTNNEIDWNLTNASLYIGQLYPAGHVLYKVNISLKNNVFVSTPQIDMFFGDLIRVGYQYTGSVGTIILYWYDLNGNVQSNKSYTLTSNYSDTMIEYFSNGTTHIYDTYDGTKSLWSSKYPSNIYPYNYISPTLIYIANTKVTPNPINVTIYNFEEKIPKSLITVMPRNNTFAFGFDARSNASYGIDYINSLGYKSTFWWDRVFWYGSTYNDSTRTKFLNYMNNNNIEFGIHFSTNLTNNPSWQSLVDAEMLNASQIFGKYPTSWGSLQNVDNSTHANYIWNTYGTFWRNAPQSIVSFGALGNMQVVATTGDYINGTTNFWNNASQKRVYFPAFTHGVLPLGMAPQEGYDMDLTNFTNIFLNYSNSGITIEPYTQWYQENNNTVQPITNVIFNGASATFSINTTGYNATTNIYDLYPYNAWVADNGIVISNITGIGTNITIITNTVSPVRRTSMSIIPSSNYIIVNIIVWNTNQKVFTTTGSSFTATIRDNIPFKNYNVINNKVLICMCGANSTGYITFSGSSGQYSISDTSVTLLPKNQAAADQLGSVVYLLPALLIIGLIFLMISRLGIDVSELIGFNIIVIILILVVVFIAISLIGMI